MRFKEPRVGNKCGMGKINGMGNKYEKQMGNYINIDPKYLVPADYNNISLFRILMKESKACKPYASRLGEAWPRPYLERKRYCYKDKTKLMGTYYIILIEITEFNN